MADIATLARPYAEAVFRVAKSGSNEALSAWGHLLDELAFVVQHPDVAALMHNPSMTADKVADTVAALLRSPQSSTQEAKNFVHTLATYHRLSLLPEIAAQYHVLKNTQEGAADAVIRSAFALTDEQVASLRTTLEIKFGRKLNASVKVDPSLIGGVSVAVGDEVLDTSVRAKLDRMQTALTA
jgi:F-type H+-transporting ATPase subunit delta